MTTTSPLPDAEVSGRIRPLTSVFGGARRWSTAHPVLSTVLRRVLSVIPLLLVLSAFTFVLVSLIPGDAARSILGDQGTREAYLALRKQLGLDQPLWERYVHWLGRAVHGDFGASIASHENVRTIINERLPVTMSLMVGGLIVIALVGVAVGILTAVRHSWVSRLVDVLAMIGFATPAFWMGALLISWFSVDLGWLPATGYTNLTMSPSRWLQSLILPVVALGISGTAAVAKQVREAMAEILSSEYIRMARASGISPKSIVLRHAFKNAAPRAVTVIGLTVVSLVGGVVLIEALFALPGLGLLAVSSVGTHDITVIQGLVVYFAIMVVIINLLVDISYTWLNPKVRRK